MNTKRRVLSFLMALVMVLGVMAVLPITISAAGLTSFDVRLAYEFNKSYLTEANKETYADKIEYYKRVDYVPYAEAGQSPQKDGTIGNNEYTVKNPVQINTYSDSNRTQNLAYDYAYEYFAQDAEYFYLAFEMPNWAATPLATKLNLCFNASRDISSNKNIANMYSAFGMRISTTDAEGTSALTWQGDAGNYTTTAITDGITDMVAFKAPTAQDTTAYIEYKISKAQFAAAFKKNVNQITDFSYSLEFGSTDETNKYNYIANPFFSGLYPSTVSLGTNASTADVAKQIYRNVGLVDVFADDYRDVAGVDVPYEVGDAPNVLDGTIGNDEYTVLSDKTQVSYRNNGATLNNTVVKEYFSHDDEYVYFAFTMNNFDSAKTSCNFRLNTLNDGRIASSFGGTSLFTISTGGVKYEGGRWTTAAECYGSSPDSAYSEYSAINAEAGKLTVNGTVGTAEFKIKKSALIASTVRNGFEPLTAETFTNLRYSINYKAADSSTADGLWVCTNTQATAACKRLLIEDDIGDNRYASNLAGRNLNLVYDNIVSADVGSVRIDTAETSGLRFQTTVSKAYLAELEAAGYTVEAGTIIAPEDFNIAEHTDGTVNEHYIDVAAKLEYPYHDGVTTVTFTGAIVNINPGNLDRNFTAIGYLAITKGGNTEYVYSNAVTKNVSEVAQAAIDSGKYNEDTDALAILNALLAN